MTFLAYAAAFVVNHVITARWSEDALFSFRRDGGDWTSWCAMFMSSSDPL
jgi:hypothetical protein